MRRGEIGAAGTWMVAGNLEFQLAGFVVGQAANHHDAIAEGELHGLIKKQTEALLPEPPNARGFEIRHE